MKSNPFVLDNFVRQVFDQAKVHGINPKEVAERLMFLVENENAEELIALQRAAEVAGFVS